MCEGCVREGRGGCVKGERYVIRKVGCGLLL